MERLDEHEKKALKGPSEDEAQLFDNLEFRLWTYQDLSWATKIPENTLQRWVMEGRLEPIRIGRLVRFDPKETIRKLKNKEFLKDVSG